jgi:diadenosine tetraphosphatase ApaH/serine/threonine PP2A family protein phosphatase
MWTLNQLSAEHREWLESLPRGPVVVDDVELCHGSPDDEDEYIFEPVDAIEALRGTQRRVCFFGHTHVALVYWMSIDAFDMLMPEGDAVTELTIRDDRRYLINPGSVGQPRDGDPRASYATFDSETGLVRLHRVDYDVQEAQTRITAAGLPDGLARRLALGK